ncbi:MAG: RDD family protein [Actinomycetota bacterium]
MSYEDRIRFETPEGVDLDLILAGLGSRVGAAFLDAVIRWGTLVVIGFVLGFISTELESGAFFVAVFAPTFLAIELGYDIAFETLNGGRTVGKRAFGIRVLRVGGLPVDFRSSAVRNIVRLVDTYLTLYVAGVIAIFSTRNSQRLGDLAAGTLVVRDRIFESPRNETAYQWTGVVSDSRWDVTLVTPQEVGALRQFLQRRDYLPADVRSRIAHEFAARLRPKIGGMPEMIHPEAMIEEIVRAKSTMR